MLLELPREIRDMIYDLVYFGAFVEVVPFSCTEVLVGCADSLQASAHTDNSDQLRVRGRLDSQGQSIELRSRPRSKSVQEVHPPKPLYLPITSISTTTAKEKEIPWCRGGPVVQGAKPRRRQKTTVVISESAKIKGASLLFSCKQICEEFGQTVYGKTIFAFASRTGLLRLLRDGGQQSPRTNPMRLPLQLPVTATNRSSIRHLCLNIKPYGEPRETLDAIWRDKYYCTWKATCLHVINALPDLERLTLLVEIPNDRPYSLNLKAPWITPLLQFSRMEKIKAFSITLTSSRAREVSTETLHAFAEVVHRELSGWDTPSALEAIMEHSRRCKKDATGRSLDRQWEALKRWNGLSLCNE